MPLINSFHGHLNYINAGEQSQPDRLAFLYIKRIIWYNRAMDKQKTADRACFTAVLFAAAAFTAVFGFLGVMRYRQYAYPDYDFTINVQKYWSILHSDGRISMLGDVNILGNGFELIAYPMSLLYYVMLESRQALLVIQPLMIAFSALILFRIFRDILPVAWAACLCVSYLLNPGISNSAAGQYYDVGFCAIPLLGAFYFMKKEKFEGFSACIFIALLFRADIALITFMFGVYALLTKKSRRWYVFPIMLSVIWAFSYLFLIRPSVLPRINYETFYPGPKGAISAFFSYDNLKFLFQLLAPVIFLPLLSVKEMLLPLLVLLRQAFSTNFQHHRLILHYPMLILPYFYIAAAFGLKKVINSTGRGAAIFNRGFPPLIILVALSSNIWFGPINNAGSYLLRTAEQEPSRKADAMLTLIPDDASVITTFNYSSHLANRRRLYSYHSVTDNNPSLPYKGYRLPRDIDYALIDFSDSMTSQYYSDRDSDVRARDFFAGGKWGIIDSADNTVLLKNGGGSRPLYSIVESNRAGKPVFTINNMALLDYTAVKNGDFIDTDFHWGCLGPINDDIFILFRVIGPDGKEVHRSIKRACYGVYPTYRWKQGEAIEDGYRIFLPKGKVPRGNTYTLKMSLVSPRNIGGLEISPGEKEITIGDYAI